jgi:hypothetical protein
MNPTRARAALVIAAIAVGSAIAGAGIDRWAVMHSPRRGRGAGPAGILSNEAAARRRSEMLERLTKELELTAPQRAGIDSIMARTDSALRVVRTEMQPRVRQIFDSSRAEISARLDSAQRVKFLQQRLEPGRRRE